MKTEKLEILSDWIKESNHIVFFGGAGVSTESGIPDFRSKDGLYHLKYDVSPEEILSHHYFLKHPHEFYRFYRDKLDSRNCKPNITHEVLVMLEKLHKLDGIVTQNIDGLHERAGSKNVYNLHGSIYQNHCIDCGKSYDINQVFDGKDIPTCSCGGIIKPDVVLYEEPLDEDVIDQSIHMIEHADMLIVAGTSLKVYPANSFVRYFRGKYLVIINKETTPLDEKADLVIHEGLGHTFSYVKKKIRNNCRK